MKAGYYAGISYDKPVNLIGQPSPDILMGPAMAIVGEPE
jgi:hypothetical protein